MSVNNVNAFTPNANFNNNLDVKNDKKAKKAQKAQAKKDEFKTSYDIYKEQKKGLTRDQKTYLKAAFVAAGVGVYLAISGKGEKIVNWVQGLFK